MPSSWRRAASWLRRAAFWTGLGERACERAVRRPRRAYFPLALERLEDRVTPAQITYVWTNNGHDGSWSDASNWTNGGPASLPVGDTAVLEFDAGTAAATPAMTDNLANLTVDEIHFAKTGGTTAAGYTINGTNTINLGSAAGVVVDSGVTGGTPGTIQDVFGSGIAFNQHVASNFTDNDTGTELVIDGAVTLNNFTLTADGAYTSSGNIVPGGQGVIFDGVISQAGGVDLNGVVGLNGPNTYTGTTTLGNISGAILEVGSNSGLGNAANTTVLTTGSNSGLNLDGVSVTQANLIFNSGNTLYSAFSSSAWNGPITLEGGTETLATIGSGIGSGSRLAINGVIGGAGALSVGGLDVPGVVELEQNNTYTGVTTVGDIFGGTVAGTLQIDAPAGLGAGGSGNGTTVTSGSTLALDYTSGARLQDGSGNAEQLTLNGTGIGGLGALTALVGASAAIPGAVTLAGATTIGVHTGVLTFDAPIGQSTTSTLTIAAGGTIVFDAANTYSGTTTLINGALQVNGNEPGAFTAAPLAGFAATLNGSGSVGAVTLSTSAAGNLGATLAPGDSFTFTPGILHTGNVTLDAGSTFNSVLNGPTVGSQYSQLDSTGTVTLNSAKLTIDVGAALAANTTFTLIQAASVVGTFGNAPTSGSNITLGGYTFKITYTSTTVVLTFLGVVDFWTGAAGDGLWSDGGNWVGGAAPVNGATVVFETNLTTTAGGSTLNTGANAYNTVDDIPNLTLNEILFDDGTAYSVHSAGSADPFALGGATAQPGMTGYTIGGTNTITLGAGANIVVENGVWSGSGRAVAEVFGTGVTLQASVNSSVNITNDGAPDVDFDGPISLSGSTLTVLAEGVNNSFLTGHVAFNGVISGSGSLNLGGTVTLAAANTYVGTTTIGASASGDVLLTNGSGLGASGNTVTTAANSGSGLNLYGISVTQANFNLGADTVVYAYAGSGSGGPDDTWNGPITLNNGTFASIQTVGAGVRVAINGAIGGNAGGFEAGGAEGSGVVEFEQANTFTGAISVGASFPEALQIDNPAGLGAGGAGNGTTVDAGSTLLLAFPSPGSSLEDSNLNAEQLTLDGSGVNGLGALQTLNGDQAYIPGAVTLAGNTTVGVGTGFLDFVAAIGQSTTSALTIAEDTGSGGAGTVTFFSTNTYTGGTTVAGGTLTAESSEPGPFTVAPVSGVSAVLNGFYSVGAVTFNTAASGNQGATLAPGAGLETGVLTASSVTLDAGSTFSPQLDAATSAGSGYSQLVCNGPLNLNNATLDLQLGAVFAPNSTFTIIQDSLLSGVFGNAPNGQVLSFGGLQVRINYTATTVTATVLSNPTTQVSTVNVTQSGQAVQLALVVQFPPGTTSINGTATFQDANGNPVASKALTFDPTTHQGIATTTVNTLSLGSQKITAFALSAIAGAVYSYTGGGGSYIPGPTLNISPADSGGLAAIQLNVFFFQTLTAIGGDGAYTFSVVSGVLPRGMALDPPTGNLFGTPTGGGTYPFTVQASDPNVGLSADVAYAFTIQPPTILLAPGEPNGLTYTLPATPQGVPYSEALGASGGVPGYTFALAPGQKLPNGLSLNPSTGVISGTPTAAGLFTFTITATDSSAGAGPYSGSQTYNLTVTQGTGGSSVPYAVAVIAGAGVWRHSSAGWRQLTPAGASQAVVDAKGDVAVEIPGAGVWRFEDASGWSQLTPADVTLLAVDARGDVAAEIPGAGVWRYEDASGWRQLTPADVTLLSIAGSGAVAAEIPGFGVWRYEDAGGWTQLTPADATLLAVDARGDVAAEIPGAGVWRFEDAGGWAQLTPSGVTQLSIAGNGVVAAEIPGAGVWRYEDSSLWQQLDGRDASQVAIDSHGDVLAELLAGGVWLYQDANGWNELTPADALFLELGG